MARSDPRAASVRQAVCFGLAAALALAASVGAGRAEMRIFGAPGGDCRQSCANRCQMLPCNGLNVAQCDRARQSCRRTCETRCR
jgi:hypothetical protein